MNDNLTLFFNIGYCGIPKGSVCPEEITIGWHSISPYLTALESDNQENDDLEVSVGTNSNLSGAITEVTLRGFDHCCRNNVTLLYTTRFADITTLVDASVNSSLDVVLPIRTNVGKEKFLTFPFVGLSKFDHYCQ